MSVFDLCMICPNHDVFSQSIHRIDPGAHCNIPRLAHC